VIDWLSPLSLAGYPFILPNLFLSMLAATQAPIIMMSPNRQDAKNRVRSQWDYEVNRRAAADIQGLARKLNFLGEQISDLEDLIRANTVRQSRSEKT
jgi:CRP/FNR family transcriptional regulator, cyclic AMP receptor protein